MGRGGYFGGSSLVGPGGWGSFDPAASGQSKPARKAGKRRSTALRQANANQKSPGSYRLSFLNHVIDTALRNQPMPSPPRRAPDWFISELQQARRVANWARSQPGFSELLAAKQKKLAKKEVKTGTKPKGPPRGSVSFAIAELARLHGERQKFEAALEEAMQIARSCEASIARIDKKISALSGQPLKPAP